MDRDFVELYFELGHKSQAIKRKYRERLKAEAPKPMQSLQDAPRYHYDDDGEGYVKYGILDVQNMSDNDIADILREDYRAHQIHSPYDCTGKIFMAGYHWKRIADGNQIALVQRYGLDV